MSSEKPRGSLMSQQQQQKVVLDPLRVEYLFRVLYSELEDTRARLVSVSKAASMSSDIFKAQRKQILELEAENAQLRRENEELKLELGDYVASEELSNPVQAIKEIEAKLDAFISYIKESLPPNAAESVLAVTETAAHLVQQLPPDFSAQIQSCLSRVRVAAASAEAAAERARMGVERMYNSPAPASPESPKVVVTLPTTGPMIPEEVPDEYKVPEQQSTTSESEILQIQESGEDAPSELEVSDSPISLTPLPAGKQDEPRKLETKPGVRPGSGTSDLSSLSLAELAEMDFPDLAPGVMSSSVMAAQLNQMAAGLRHQISTSKQQAPKSSSMEKRPEPLAASQPPLPPQSDAPAAAQLLECDYGDQIVLSDTDDESNPVFEQEVLKQVPQSRAPQEETQNEANSTQDPIASDTPRRRHRHHSSRSDALRRAKREILK